MANSRSSYVLNSRIAKPSMISSSSTGDRGSFLRTGGGGRGGGLSRGRSSVDEDEVESRSSSSDSPSLSLGVAIRPELHSGECGGFRSRDAILSVGGSRLLLPLLLLVKLPFELLLSSPMLPALLMWYIMPLLLPGPAVDPLPIVIAAEPPPLGVTRPPPGPTPPPTPAPP